MIRVLLLDDHPVVREGLATVLSADGDIRVVGAVATVDEALDALEWSHPDLVLVDVRLPGTDGLDGCEMIRGQFPAVRVVVLTGVRNERIMVRAFEAGATGFLLKESSPDVMREALRSIMAGGTFVDPHLARHVVSASAKGRRAKGPLGLTPQQLRVLELLPKGWTNRQIGDHLGLSADTVKTHLRHAMRKLDVTDRTQAAALVEREGWA